LQTLARDGHYLGAHSDQHLLYCDWTHRDSLLVTREEFETDLENNYLALKHFLSPNEEAFYYLPPYEWYNDSISAWTRDMGLQLVNYTSGTLSHADYTIPGTPQYRGSQEIYKSILLYESEDPQGLNGFILLSHIGTHEDRTDKFYHHLNKLLTELKQRGYSFKRIDELL
jgi:peptidoglycan/xylan/chitin deacetylase (PgdA/CDA1 family)